MFMNYVGMEIWVSQVFLDWVILSGYPSCQGTTLSGCNYAREAKLSNFVPLTTLCLISLGQVKKVPRDLLSKSFWGQNGHTTNLAIAIVIVHQLPKNFC